MWENAAPTPRRSTAARHPGRRRRVSQSDGDYVIWGQLLLSLAFLALVLLAQMMDLPFLPALRPPSGKHDAEQNTFLSENRELSNSPNRLYRPLQTPCRSLCRHRAKPPHRKTLYARPMQKRNRFLPARGKKFLPSFRYLFPVGGSCLYRNLRVWLAYRSMGGSGRTFTWEMTWQRRRGPPFSGRRLMGWCAVLEYTAAMAATCVSFMRMGMKHCMPTCSICLCTPDSGYLPEIVLARWEKPATPPDRISL